MIGFTIKDAAEELNISDKALYKRISSNNFNTDYIEKVDGRTIITPEGMDYLKGVVRRKKSGGNDSLYDSGIMEKDIVEISAMNSSGLYSIYTDNDIEIVKMLRDEVEFLRSQLQEQSIHYQEQFKIQAETYKKNLEIQLENMKSKEKMIFNMQEMLKSQDETNKKLLDYTDIVNDVDDSIPSIKRDLVSRKDRRKSKHKKNLFGFFK